MTTFAELQLMEPLLRAINDQGYDTPTPIQVSAIPHLLEGRDLFGIAQTGTGKTAAFALPILDYLAGDPRPPQTTPPERARAHTHARTCVAKSQKASRATASTPTSSMRWSSVAWDRALRCAPSSRASMCLSQRRGACSTSWNSVTSTSATSKSSYSTKPTACSTWALSEMYAKSLPKCPRTVSHFCSRPPCLQKIVKAGESHAQRPCARRGRPTRKHRGSH